VRPLRLGTRGSLLARRQAEMAAEALRRAVPDLEIETVLVRTEGDRRAAEPLEAIGGQGVFVKDIEARLQAGEIDLAVHSLKDMPPDTPAGLVVGAYLPRDDARDAIAGRDGLDLARLPAGARIGSDSRRRAVQLLAIRPDLRIESIRGNVDTRLRKVDAGEYDGAVLAVAGLQRLGLLARATDVFPPEAVLPAAGQGTIAIECREADSEVLGLLRAVDDAATRTAALAERAFLRALGAGCRLPIGAYAVVADGEVRLAAMLADDAGGVHRGEARGPASSAETVGRSLALRLRTEAGA